MPFDIRHKCNQLGAWVDYAAMVSRDGTHTILICETCREQLVIVGNGAFREAKPTPDSLPGFLTEGSKPS